MANLQRRGVVVVHVAGVNRCHGGRGVVWDSWFKVKTTDDDDDDDGGDDDGGGGR